MTHTDLINALVAVSPSPIRLVKVSDSLIPPDLPLLDGLPEFYVQQGGEWPTISFDYINHKGARSRREVVFMPHTCRWTVYYGTTPQHPDPQWLFRAFDLHKMADRDFAVKDITNLKAEYR